MSWHVAVDREVCIGSGIRAGTAPEAFRLDDDRSHPVAAEIEPDETVLDAADSCPVLAITVHSATGEELGPRP